MKKQFSYKTKIGNLYITEENSFIVGVSNRNNQFDAVEMETLLMRETITQINEYLDGMRDTFQIPILATGTKFQKLVWQEITKIPYGETASYKDIAERINNSRAIRAVGMAAGKNPLMVLVPCHRVVSADGKPGGYSGGEKTKQFLLNLEQLYAEKNG